MCGIHAQIPLAADLSIGARVDGLTRGEVQRQLWDVRSLVRTYGIRGTVHLFPADELALWLAAFRANPSRNTRAVLETMGIEQAQMDAMVDAVGDALDGRRLTREELGAEIVRRVGRWAGVRAFPAFGDMQPRWSPAIGHAATAGALCFGPNQGSKVTFVRPDQWIGRPTGRRVGGRAALAEVLRRYLAAYGPATLAEFAQWFNASPETARIAARRLGEEIVQVHVEGTPALAPAGDEHDGARSPGGGSLRLLPSFDVYVVGSHPRDVLIPPAFVEHARRHRASLKWAVAGRAQFAGPIPVLVIDGAVSGMWERRATSKRTEIRVEAFTDLTPRQRARLEDEVERIGAFLETPVSVTLGPLR